MKTISYSMKEVLRRAKNEQFKIPQFQRRFRWRNSQVKLLVDSLARNYPIGSLLMLAKNPEVPLKSRSVEAEIGDIDLPSLETEENPGAETYYILDGQQRLTSITRVFLDADPKFNYYFDLYKMLKGFSTEDTAWVVSRRRGKKDYKRKDNNRLLRADVVLDQQEADVFISEYVEDSDDFPEFEGDRKRARQAAAKIKGIFEIIRNYKVPVVVLDSDAPLESVCRVFETINSTGTRLTTFDLAVARYYPNPDLRDLWESTQEAYPVLDRYDVDGERVLQVLSLWDSYKRGAFSEPSRGKLLTLERNFINSNWNEASIRLAEAYEWAENNGASPRTLPSHNILVSIAAFFVLFPNVIEHPTQNLQSMLRRWYYSKVLQSGARTASNYMIGLDFDSLVTYAKDGKPLEAEEVKLNVSILNRTNRGADNRYKALHCIMALSAKEDMISGVSLDGDAEDHHIFPRSLSKNYDIDKNKLNAITNRVIISRASNNFLSDTLPENYFLDLQNRSIETGTEGDVNRRLRQNLIPGDIAHATFVNQFKRENFDRFLEDRATLLLEKVREIIGKSLIVPKGSHEDDSEY